MGQSLYLAAKLERLLLLSRQLFGSTNVRPEVFSSRHNISTSKNKTRHPSTPSPVQRYRTKFQTEETYGRKNCVSNIYKKNTCTGTEDYRQNSEQRSTRTCLGLWEYKDIDNFAAISLQSGLSANPPLKSPEGENTHCRKGTQFRDRSCLRLV